MRLLAIPVALVVLVGCGPIGVSQGSSPTPSASVTSPSAPETASASRTASPTPSPTASPAPSGAGLPTPPPVANAAFPNCRLPYVMGDRSGDGHRTGGFVSGVGGTWSADPEGGLTESNDVVA